MERLLDIALISRNLDSFLDAADRCTFLTHVATFIDDSLSPVAIAIYDATTGDRIVGHGEPTLDSIDVSDIVDRLEVGDDVPAVLLDTDIIDIDFKRQSDSQIIGFLVNSAYVGLVSLDGLDMKTYSKVNRLIGLTDALYRVRFTTAPTVEKIEEVSEPGQQTVMLSWYQDEQGGTINLAGTANEAVAKAVVELDDLETYLTYVDQSDRAAVELTMGQPTTGVVNESVHRLVSGDDRQWVHHLWTDNVREGTTQSIGVVLDLNTTSGQLSDLLRFRKLLDHSSDGVYVIDRESARILDVNQQACEQLGYDREELLSKTVLDIDPEFTESVWDEFKQLVKELGSARIEVNHQRKDGSIFPVEIEVSYVSLDREYHIATVRDITERKQQETELETAEKRYRSLIDTSPDAVVLIKAESWEIIDINRSAVRLFDRNPDILMNGVISDLLPEDHRSAFEESLLGLTDSTGRVFRRYENGEHIEIVRPDGELIPVSISCNTVTIDGTDQVFLAIRDVTEQLEYERALAAINDACREMLHASDAYELAEIAVSTATDTLELTAMGYFEFNDISYTLEPLVIIDSVNERIPEPPVLSVDDSIAGRVFTTGESEVHDDVREDPEVFNPETLFRSEVIVRVGGHGILIAGNERPGCFDTQTVDLLEIVASNLKAGFDSYHREQQLIEREFELEAKTASLERVEELNSQIRQLTRILIRAESKAEIESALCEHLTNADSVCFAWIGSINPIEGSIQPHAWSGGDPNYFDAVSLSLDTEGPADPAVEVFRTDSSVYIENCAREIEANPWRREAVRRSFKSMLSIPVSHRGVNHCVLTIVGTVPEAFDAEFRAVMEEVGSIVAYSMTALNRKQALISNQSVEVDFALDDPRCFFLHAAMESGCTIELNGLIPQDEDGTLAFITVLGGELDALRAYLERSSLIQNHRVLTDNGDPFVQLRFTGPFIGTQLAEYGLTLKSASAGTGACQLTVGVPPTMELNKAVDIVQTFFDEARPIGKREQGLSVTDEGRISDRYLGKLTNRQREAITLAYRLGYFNTPKDATGEDIADEMEISHSAFHSHIRNAERQLFDVLFADMDELPSKMSDSQR